MHFPPNTFYNVADALIAADHEKWNKAVDLCKRTVPALNHARATTQGLANAVSECREVLKIHLAMSHAVAYTYALIIVQCRTEGNGYRCNNRAVKIEPIELLCEDCHVPIESGVACDACGGNPGDDSTDKIGDCTTCGRMTIGEETLCDGCKEQDLIRMAELMTWPIEMHERPMCDDREKL